MPGGKAALVYAATSAATSELLFSIALPDGAVSPCNASVPSAPGAQLAPSALFAREPSELLLCLASPPDAQQPTGVLLQLT
jgi:hypothetical protein